MTITTHKMCGRSLKLGGLFFKFQILCFCCGRLIETLLIVYRLTLPVIDSETYVGLWFVVISPEYEKLPVCSEWPTCTFERQHGPRTKETHLSRHPFLVVTFITFECDFITRMVFFARIWNVRVSRNSWGFAVLHWKISKKDTNWSA